MVLLYLTILTVVAAFNFCLHYHVNPRQNGPYPLLFFFSFVACLGHLLLALSTNLDQVILSNKVIYLGSIFLPVLTFNACLSICKIKFPTWSHDFLMLLVFVVLSCR